MFKLVEMLCSKDEQSCIEEVPCRIIGLDDAMQLLEITGVYIFSNRLLRSSKSVDGKIGACCELLKLFEKNEACGEARGTEILSTGVTLPKDDATIAPSTTALAKSLCPLGVAFSFLGLVLAFALTFSPSAAGPGDESLFAPAAVA